MDSKLKELIQWVHKQKDLCNERGHDDAEEYHEQGYQLAMATAYQRVILQAEKIIFNETNK